MPITQKLDLKNHKLDIVISSSFNFELHNEFRNAYRDVQADKNLDVTVDLKNAEYMDSSALGMLLLLDEHFKEQRINITNGSDYIKQVLDVANFSMKFNIS